MLLVRTPTTGRDKLNESNRFHVSLSVFLSEVEGKSKDKSGTKKIKK